MDRFIVTTTINSPTKATLKFCEIANSRGWGFIIVGDLKTPHSEYERLETKNVMYLSPEKQETFCKELSDAIGWRKIQRRNIGFLYAYRNEAQIIATVDDDNIPYDDWGKKVYVNEEIEADIYENVATQYFDPLSVTNHRDLWHRGYPIEHVGVKNRVEYRGKGKINVMVQAELWDGDPDIDAICRLSRRPIVKFDAFQPFSSAQVSPFNSQNTFLSRKVIPFYAVLPYVGRMDDIWGSYILQHYFPNSLIYTKASVYQERNAQDLIWNLENELSGYRNTLRLLDDLPNFEKFLPAEARTFWEVYRQQF